MKFFKLNIFVMCRYYSTMVEEKMYAVDQEKLKVWWFCVVWYRYGIMVWYGDASSLLNKFALV